MGKQFAYIFFGIEFFGTLVALCKLVFFAGVETSGGLDLMGYEIPGLSETFLVLPIAFPLTVLAYALYPKLKNQILASLLLVLVLISNVILVIQVLRILINWVG